MNRKNRGYKRGEPFRDAIQFVIACEGAERERQYFEHIATDPRRVKVIVLAPENPKNGQKNAEKSGPSPRWVLNRLIKYLEENRIDAKNQGDKIWIVLDVDRWPKGELIALASQCSDYEWGFALSNPCFEVWLYLHVKPLAEPVDTSCQDLKTILGALELGGKKHYHLETYLKHATSALDRGDQQPDDLKSPIPHPLTTRVHLLVRQLINLT